VRRSAKAGSSEASTPYARTELRVRDCDEEESVVGDDQAVELGGTVISTIMRGAACASLTLVGLTLPATAQATDEKPITCTEEGYFGNPNDASKYYRCVDFEGSGEKFTVFHFQCAAPTVWDQSILTCNLPSNIPPGGLSGPILGEE
jgi:hypothetical protein